MSLVCNIQMEYFKKIVRKLSTDSQHFNDIEGKLNSYRVLRLVNSFYRKLNGSYNVSVTNLARFFCQTKIGLAWHQLKLPYKLSVMPNSSKLPLSILEKSV